MTHYHPYHLVQPSPWPMMGAMGAFGMTTGAAMYFNSYMYGEKLLMMSLMLVVGVMMVWWSDVIREATYMGHHTKVVQSGLSMGMMWFMGSEVLLFVSFFWAFFHSALVPTVELGSMWPPVGMSMMDPYEVPLLNTALLLASGGTMTWSHSAMMAGDSKETMVGLMMTVLLGVVFTGLQVMEYYEASFTMADSVYGSVFFLATGFHGMHVCMGEMFLMVSLMSMMDHQMTKHHHNGYEAAMWYWHFVDTVWVFLYIAMYWWGS